MRPDRSLLLLSPGFPPVQTGIASFRAAGFSRYLPDLGITPIILAPGSPVSSDGRRLPPGVRVLRAPELPTPSTLFFRILKKLRRKAEWKGSREGPTRPGAEDRQDETFRDFSALQGIVRATLRWLDTPDWHVGWLPFAVVRGLGAVVEHRPDAVWGTGPPFSTVLSAAIIARTTDLPLIVDMRDIWTLDPRDPHGSLGGYFRAPSIRLRRELLRTLERWCLLERADRVVFTSARSMSLYESEFPQLAGKTRLIPNGAIPELFDEPMKRYARPTICHVGTVHPHQCDQVVEFFETVSRARERNRVPGDLIVRFVGAVGDLVREQLERELTRLQLIDVVSLEPPVSHSSALEILRRSHAGLLFDGGNPYIRLAKLSEYVASGTPMLAVGNPTSETCRAAKKRGARILETGRRERNAELLGDAVSEGLERSVSPSFPLAPDDEMNRRANARTLAATVRGLLQPR